MVMAKMKKFKPIIFILNDTDPYLGQSDKSRIGLNRHSLGVKITTG